MKDSLTPKERYDMLRQQANILAEIALETGIPVDQLGKRSRRGQPSYDHQRARGTGVIGLRNAGATTSLDPQRREVQTWGIFRRHGASCYICRRELTIDQLHIDHVIPLAKGGTNHSDNLRPACAKCNIAKSDRIVASDAKTHRIIYI